MPALHMVTNWPVDHVAAAIVSARGIETVGDTERIYRLASLSKPVTAWAVMVAVEEGTVDLDAPLQHVAAADGTTLRHLLSHAGGFGFNDARPTYRIERRRMYSNTGIELAATELEGASGLPFVSYLTEAVFQPLEMNTAELRGSPAAEIYGSVDDVSKFLMEMRDPKLLARETVTQIVTPQFPHLAGIVPDVGRFDPCPWGLGVEVRGDKSPHWTGQTNSAATFGHFGGSGTMMWFDPLADVGVVALTDRPFDEWRDDALRLWPEFSDAVLAEHRSAT